MQVRPYEPGDRAAIEALAAEIVADGSVFPFEDVQGVLDYWFGPATRVFVAREGGVALGTYVIKPNHPGRGAHVANAGYMVAEHARGRGVGRALCEDSIARARELGFLALQFNQVVATNTAAVRLWESLGFERIGTLPRAFRHPTAGLVDTLVFYRALA